MGLYYKPCPQFPKDARDMQAKETAPETSSAPLSFGSFGVPGGLFTQAPAEKSAAEASSSSSPPPSGGWSPFAGVVNYCVSMTTALLGSVVSFH